MDPKTLGPSAYLAMRKINPKLKLWWWDSRSSIWFESWTASLLSGVKYWLSEDYPAHEPAKPEPLTAPSANALEPKPETLVRIR